MKAVNNSVATINSNPFKLSGRALVAWCDRTYNRWYYATRDGQSRYER